MNSWSSGKTWWMDLLKFMITFFIAALLTVTIINKCEDRRGKRQFIQNKRFENNLRIYQDFKKYSLLYYRSAVDAYADMIKRKKREDSENIERFLTEANDNFRLVLESVEENFGKPDELGDVKKYRDGIFTEYKRTLALILDFEEGPPDAEIENRANEFRQVAEVFLISRAHAIRCLEGKLRKESE